MVTDEDRVSSRQHARLIYQHHLETSDGVGAEANHIAADIPYEESLYRGKLGECAFSHEFGIPVNFDVYRYGDGGRDFSIWLDTRQGVRKFIVDVKAKTVRASWPALRDSETGTHLRVEIDKCVPTTIYVFGIYLAPTDDAEVLAWEWGSVMIARNERANWPNGNDEPCYIKPFGKLRDLQDLKDRMIRSDRPCRICANPSAPFGYRAPMILSGEEWRCLEHRL